MQKFRFLLPFSDQLGKIANAYSLGSIWCWNVSWTMHTSCAIALDVPKRDVYFIFYAKVFVWFILCESFCM